MAGKYSSVIGKLPRFEDPDASHVEKVEKVKAELRAAEDFSDQPEALGAIYARLRAQKDELAEQVSAVGLQLDAISALLIEQLEHRGMTNFSLTPVVIEGTVMMRPTIRLETQPYAQVKDKEAFRLWCIANGLERSLQLWPSTTQSLVKERLLEGLPDPDGIVATMLPKLKFSKG